MDQLQTVTRALAILEILGKHRLLPASSINKHLGYHRSTTYRLLATLKQLGYIRRDEKTGLYSLSTKILTMAASIQDQFDIAGTARPILEALQKKTGETVHLATLNDGEVVYLDKIESTRALRVVMSSRTGQRAPLYCTGIGKVFLAAMSGEELDGFFQTADLTRYTENTRVDRESLLAEIERVRENGYALDREEHEIGVFCVAVPVRGPAGAPIASLSVSLPSVRRSAELEKQLVRDVMAAAAGIGEELSGGRGAGKDPAPGS